MNLPSSPTGTFSIAVHDSFRAIAPEAWDACAGDQQPFVSHAFLSLLETTRCIGNSRGWRPMLVTLSDARGLAATAPAFLKSHSYGEFVFDFAWAQAYARVGLEYYPKLVVAVPFTPATGPRLLVRPDLDFAAVAPRLLQALVEAAEQRQLSSIHALFVESHERRLLEESGWLMRRDCQFHWTDHAYGDFEGFLASFTAEKRKKARRDRRRVAEAGIRFDTLHGDLMSARDLRDVWILHRDTFVRHGHDPYLSLEFFEQVARALGRGFVVKAARLGENTVAAAIFFRGRSTLFGRYWGANGDYHSLHFETCYYQGIDYCLQEGLTRFEPGTQGEHKISRGFEPSLTWSGHHIVDPRFRGAIRDYLLREGRMVDEYAAAVENHVPFRADAKRDRGPHDPDP